MLRHLHCRSPHATRWTAGGTYTVVRVSLPQTKTAPFGDEDSGIRPFLRAIVAHRVLVVLTTLAALAGAISFLILREPQYEATATVLVSALAQDDDSFLGLDVLRSSGDATRTVQTAAAVLDSPEAAERSAGALGEGWTARRVLDSVDVAPQGESNIVAVTATAGSARLAAQLADTFARGALEARGEELSRQVRDAIATTEAELSETPAADPNAAVLSARLSELQSLREGGDPTLAFEQAATIPTAPTSPGPFLVIPLALVAGLALGCSGALLRELLDRRIVDADEALAEYPISVLARVPLLSERNLRGPEGAIWHMPMEVGEAFLSVAAQLEQRDRKMGSVMVTSPTRGDGKTSSVINLAITLTSLGKRVVVLDCDLRNPQVGTALGLGEARGLNELMDPSRDVEQLLIPTRLRALEVLPIRGALEGAMASQLANRRLPELIEQAGSLADHVLVDTAPLGEVSDALRLAEHVDDILVVMRPGNTDRGHLQVMRELLERSGFAPDGCIIFGAGERPARGYYGDAIVASRGDRGGESNGGAVSLPEQPSA